MKLDLSQTVGTPSSGFSTRDSIVVLAHLVQCLTLVLTQEARVGFPHQDKCLMKLMNVCGTFVVPSLQIAYTLIPNSP